MRLLGRFEEQEQSGEQRGSARRALRLNLPGQALGARQVPVTVLDLSLTGFLIQTEAALARGETFQIELPEDGNVEASIVWNSGRLFGCQFNRPISPATLSAAILKGDARSIESPTAVPEPVDVLAQLRAITAQVERITAKVERSVERLEQERDDKRDG